MVVMWPTNYTARSFCLAEQTEGHLDTMCSLYAVEKAVVGTAGLSRVSQQNHLEISIFFFFKAMPISQSALQNSKRAAPVWEIGYQVSCPPARPASPATMAVIPSSAMVSPVLPLPEHGVLSGAAV